MHGKLTEEQIVIEPQAMQGVVQHLAAPPMVMRLDNFQAHLAGICQALQRITEMAVARDRASANEWQGSLAEDHTESIEKFTKDQITGPLARWQMAASNGPSAWQAGSIEKLTKDQIAGPPVRWQRGMKRGLDAFEDLSKGCEGWVKVDKAIRRKAAIRVFTQQTVCSGWVKVDSDTRRKAAICFFTQRARPSQWW